MSEIRAFLFNNVLPANRTVIVLDGQKSILNIPGVISGGYVLMSDPTRSSWLRQLKEKDKDA